jgi:UDP-glucose 4-epimerase
MKKILLLGASGFLGGFLYQHFMREGYIVKSASRKGGVSDFQLDMADASAWKNIVFEPDIIVNCATILPGGNMKDQAYAERVFHTNFWGAYQLCQWVDTNPSVKYILNISSLAVVQKPWPAPLSENGPTYPTGPHVLYSLSKLNQEVILTSYPFKHQPKVVHARLSALFGEKMPWNGIVSHLIDKGLHKETMTLTNGDKVSFDLLYVKDACFYLTALIQNEVEGIVNVASGNEIFLLDLAQQIASIMDVDITILNEDKADVQQNRALIDINKLSYFCAYKNTPLRQALSNTIEYRKASMKVLN